MSLRVGLRQGRVGTPARLSRSARVNQSLIERTTPLTFTETRTPVAIHRMPRTLRKTISKAWSFG